MIKRPEERKTVRLSVPLSAYEYELLQRMRQKHGINISQFIRELIVFGVIRYDATEINKNKLPDPAEVTESVEIEEQPH